MATQNPTSNYNWTLPTVGGSADAWGTILNAIIGDDVTGIDAVVKAVSDVANAALPKAGGTVTGEVTFNVTPKMDAIAEATAGAGVTVDGLLIKDGAIPVSGVPNLPASKIASGTFDVARIPDLAASKITSGTFDAARIPTLPTNKISPGLFTGGVFAFDTGLRVYGGGTSTMSGAGTLALKTSGSTPFISWHDSDGTRVAYVQAGSATSLFRIRSEAPNIPMVFDVNSTEAMRITAATGNVSIGYTSDQGAKLAVNGTVLATTFIKSS